jgi:hypothetical protein
MLKHAETMFGLKPSLAKFKFIPTGATGTDQHPPGGSITLAETIAHLRRLSFSATLSACWTSAGPAQLASREVASSENGNKPWDGRGVDILRPPSFQASMFLA